MNVFHLNSQRNFKQSLKKGTNQIHRSIYNKLDKNNEDITPVCVIGVGI